MAADTDVERWMLGDSAESLTTTEIQETVTLVMHAADLIAGETPHAAVAMSDSPEGLVTAVEELLDVAGRHQNVHDKPVWVEYFAMWSAKLAGMSVYARRHLLDAVLWGSVGLRLKALGQETTGSVLAIRIGGSFMLVANADKYADSITAVDISDELVSAR